MIGGETLKEMRAVEVAALRSATLANDACERVASSHHVRGWSPDIAAPLHGGAPDAPLLSALEDLGATAYAAARAVHFSSAASRPELATLVTEVALATVHAVDLGMQAAAHRDDVSGLRLRVDLAHVCAGVTHRIADALDQEAPVTPWILSGGGRPPVPFPPSWRRLNTLLSEAIQTETLKKQHEPVTETALAGPAASSRLDAARAARDAVERVLRSYARCRITSATARLLCRCARRAARATSHAGFAALVPPAAAVQRPS
jgi:hypothetical protein